MTGSFLLQPRGVIPPSRFQEAGTSLERAHGHWCRGLLSLLCTPTLENSDHARGDGAWESRESELQADAH